MNAHLHPADRVGHELCVLARYVVDGRVLALVREERLALVELHGDLADSPVGFHLVYSPIGRPVPEQAT